MNFGIGYGIEIEGDPASGGVFTQVGAIQNSNCSLCRIGIWAPQAASDIQVQGGTYSGPGATSSPSYPSYGVDFETSQSGSTTGSIRIIGTAFRINSTASVNFFDCQGCQVITIKGEQVAASPFVGIAVQADGTTHCTGDVVVGGGFANYATGVKVTSNCSNPLLLLPPLTSVTTAVSNNASTPIELSGANGLMLRGSSVSSPTTAGQFSYNNTNSQFVGGLGGTTGVFPTFTGANPTNGDCAKWVAAGQLADAGSSCATPNNAAIFFWCTGSFTANTTAFLFPGPNGQGCNNVVAPTAGMPLPFAGTLRNLQVVVGAAGTSATGETVTVFKNGSSTLLACTLVMTTTCNNTGTNVSVSAGDTIYAQVTVPTGDTLVKDMRLGVQLQ